MTMHTVPNAPGRLARRRPARRRPARRRGFALITTVLLMAVVSITAAALMALVGNTIAAAQKRTDSTEAFNMANTGLDLGRAWLSEQFAPPDAPTLSFSGNTFFGTNGTITNPFRLSSEAGATLKVVIDADNTNAQSVQKHYLIEATATLPSGATQTLRTYVQQNSFGKYAYFAVDDGGGFWDYNNHFEGPVHFNDGINGSTGHSTFLWQNPSTTPIFTYTGTDAFSVSDDVTWWKDTIGNASAPTTASDYAAVAAGGQATMTTGFQKDASGNYVLDASGNKIPNSPAIPLPKTSYQQQYAALGDPVPTNASAGDPNAPATAGVNINTASGFNQSNRQISGGISIHGDSAITLQLDSKGNQQILVTQGSATQTITIDPVNNQTTVDLQTPDKNGMPQQDIRTFTGVPNGMIYSDGNITSLSGTLADNVTDGSGNALHRSQMTIATDLANSKDVTLTGSLKYNTARNLNIPQAQDTNFNQKAGVLGLLGHHIQVGTGAPSNIEFDGSIFATQTFDDPSYASGGPKGTMTSIGGVITQGAGYFAVANNQGALVSGYSEQYHYDNRLADHPPPFFPTTGSQYQVLSWQRVVTPLP